MAPPPPLFAVLPVAPPVRMEAVSDMRAQRQRVRPAAGPADRSRTLPPRPTFLVGATRSAGSLRARRSCSNDMSAGSSGRSIIRSQQAFASSKSVPAGAVVRPLKFEDLKAVGDVFCNAFNEMLGNLGVNLRGMVRRWRKFYPLYAFLRLFPNPYQHALDVDVLEFDQQVAGLLKYSPRDKPCRRWNVDFVAIAEQFQGRGLGRYIMQTFLSRMAQRGATCFSLEVETDNGRAIKLYESLGFREYTRVTYYKRTRQARRSSAGSNTQASAPKLAGPAPRVAPPTAGAVGGVRGFDTGRDPARVYGLYEACTPKFVRWVDGLRPDDFEVGALARLAAWLRRALGQVDERRFVLEKDGQVVAFAKVAANMRGAGPHVLHLQVHPERGALFPALLAAVEAFLAHYPAAPVLTWAPGFQPRKHDALKAWGMVSSSENSCMARGASARPLNPDLWNDASAPPGPRP
eukprot:tig00001542_g9320.t1